MSRTDSIEAEGGTLEEAVASALRDLAADSSEVEVEILAPGSRGLFGLGGRPARVRVSRRVPSAAGVASEAAALPQEKGDGRARRAADGPALGHARRVLAELLQRMGFEGSVENGESEDGALLEIHAAQSSVIIGKHGQTLDALEYVLNLIVSREEESAVRIHLDCEHYRVKRRRSLEEMAQRMAEQVKKRGRPVTLDPLSPRDRRTIHLALQNERGLTTRSTGEGFYRQVMIVPSGEPKRGRSPEY